MDEGSLRQQLKMVLLQHTGRAKAIKSEALASRFGYDDDRPIRKIIEGLIDGGFPVCSVTGSPAGYFFPADVDEARKYSKSLQKRAVRIFLHRRHIIRNTARFYEKVRQSVLIMWEEQP